MICKSCGHDNPGPAPEADPQLLERAAMLTQEVHALRKRVAELERDAVRHRGGDAERDFWERCVLTGLAAGRTPVAATSDADALVGSRRDGIARRVGTDG